MAVGDQKGVEMIWIGMRAKFLSSAQIFVHQNNIRRESPRSTFHDFLTIDVVE